MTRIKTDWEVLVEQLKRFEGKRNSMYKCPAGFNTIGYGHNLDASPLSDHVIEYILMDDIVQAQQTLDRILPQWRQHDPARQMVLVNMVFQLGSNGFLKFRKFIAALDEKQYEQAAVEMLDSRAARQTPERWQELAHIMKTGKTKQ